MEKRVELIINEKEELEEIEREISTPKSVEEIKQDVEKKNKQLLFLAQKSTILQETLDLGQTITLALQTFIEFGFDRARLYFYNQKTNTLKGIKSVGTEEEVIQKICMELQKRYAKAYYCIREKKPVIDKRRHLSHYKRILKKGDIEESASLPLISKGNVIGMVSVDNKYSKKPIEYSDLETLMTAANQIAVALENAQLYTELRRQLNRLAILYDVAKVSSSTHDIEKVLNLIVIRIVKFMKIDVCTLLLLDESREKLIPKSVYKPEQMVLNFGDKDVKKSIAGRALQTKKIEYVPSIQNEENFQNKETFVKQGLTSALSIPIFIEDKPLGVLNLYTKKYREYTEREKSVLLTLTNQAGVIIRNTQLYQTIKEDNERMTAVLEITQAITSTLDLKNLLKQILEKVVHFTKADRGVIFLAEGENLITKEAISYEANVSVQVIRRTEGICGWVVRNRKPLIVNDVRLNKIRIASEFPALSEAAIPLIVKGEVIGVLDLESRYTHNFSRYRKALQALTNLIAIAIENATLYDNINRFNETLKEEIERATRELREKNEELKKLDKLKNEFVSNVSHELRTPLTSISGYAKLLHRENIGEMNQEQKEAAEVIVNESERLTRLINEVLNIAKLESGQTKLKFENVDVCEIAKETTQTMAMSAKEKGIQISITCPEDLPRIKGNRDMLKQVFLNLLNNAIKFTEKGEVAVLLQQQEKNVVIQFKDTGIGIPEKEMKNLFKKFHQVDSSTSRKYSGSGLGLSIVKHIVTQHKGEVTVESNLGEGTTVSVVLPLMFSEK